MTGTGNRLLIASFLATVGVVSWRQVKAGNVPPSPSVYLSTGVVYALLGFVSIASEDLAATLAVGVLIAVLLGMFNTKPTPKASKGKA